MSANRGGDTSRKKCVVTGGAGFIGSHLTERLLNDGHEVIVLDNYSTGRPENLDHLKDHENLQMVETTIEADPELGRHFVGGLLAHALRLLVRSSCVLLLPHHGDDASIPDDHLHVMDGRGKAKSAWVEQGPGGDDDAPPKVLDEGGGRHDRGPNPAE